MRKLTKVLIRSSVVLVLFAAVSYSPTPAGACPPFDRTITYYNNCGSGKTQVGWTERSCSCGTVSSGTLDGLFKEVDDVYCDTGDEVITYYGRCNFGDPWEVLPDENACPNHC